MASNNSSFLAMLVVLKLLDDNACLAARRLLHTSPPGRWQWRKRRRALELIVGTVGIVEGSGGNVGFRREGLVDKAGGGGVCNKWRAARQALSSSNDRTTSIVKRELLLAAMAEERKKKG
ncbi:hypothetical protein AMTR_s00062p00214250 [Amborella trichopoda]|uniref:Uncharacterized protein n=1 Tax=Amborella trichopoda TaxID=13333 RepID=U5DH21_AMBTC|nr:hypothetical protein AMTR_s00062p00214250 [Amborella trichopoda]